MFTLSPIVLATVTGVLLPVLVALVTKVHAPPKVKVVANLVLSAVAALLLNAVNADGYAVVSSAMLATWLQQTAISIAAYLGIYKPLGAPARLAPNVGLGAPPAPVE
jgi:hypothetical protein